MPRTYGYSPKGQCCFGKKAWGNKGRTNVIGALLNKQLLCCATINGNVDTDVFHSWITQQLIPKLPPNAVIVMDNASFHKQEKTRQAITNEGFILEFLPPYSPHLNPIEHLWAKAKSIRQKLLCSVNQLFQLYVTNL